MLRTGEMRSFEKSIVKGPACADCFGGSVDDALLSRVDSVDFLI